MQDRFKLRYYFEKEKRVYNVVFIDFAVPCASLYISDEELLHVGKRDFKFENLIQCTNLKDKNGKLIYEGDIVKDDHGALHYVKWCYNGFQLNPVWKNGYTIGIVDNEIEVIGNIYQNPELLKGLQND